MAMWSLFQFFDEDFVLEVLDIGASLTAVPPYQRLIDANRARLTGFEPDPAECMRLEAVFGKPHRFLPVFVGDGKEAVFHQTNQAMTGSLFEPNTPLLEKFRNLANLTTPVAEHRVATSRLDDVHDLGSIDFLKIDVQGSELSIFKNANRILDEVMVIQTEVSFVESYKGQAMFSDVDAFLRASGFQYHTITGHGYRPFKPLLNPRSIQEGFNQQIWADAYYVRDWMRLEEVPTEKLRSYAILLHDILESFDLAHLVLVELDRRVGQAHAGKYLRRLQDGGIASFSFIEHGFGIVSQLTLSGSEESSSVSNPSAPTDTVVLTTEQGVRVAVPATLSCISTYVLLEQERWFEKEAGFVAKCIGAGATAIDVGANLGLYTLVLANSVGEAGHIFAYEPGTANRQLLESSIRLNQVANVSVSACALSDSEKTGWLQIATSGELNALVESAGAADNIEAVQVTTLDNQSMLWNTNSVDFIKIDAEGQESRIVAGGQEFFRTSSPLVMYEIKNGQVANDPLRWMFKLLGYDTYRLIGDSSILVPLGSDEHIDAFELNLFAAKPDRAEKLAKQGLLAFGAAEFSLSESERTTALMAMINQPYAQSLQISLEDIDQCPIAESLAAYSAYLYLEGIAVDRRYAALVAAYDELRTFASDQPSPSVLATYARVASDLGYISIALDVLKRISALTDVDIDQPFFPACPRFDDMKIGEDVGQWFLAGAFEQEELLGAYSSFYAQNMSRLKWLCTNSFASLEVIRRAVLVALSLGMPQRDVLMYIELLEGRQQCNSELWSGSGKLLQGLCWR